MSEHVLALVDWIRDAGALGVAVFAVAYVTAALLLLPGSLLTLGAGFAYGPLWGTLLVSPVSVLAATIAFVLGRSIARPFVSRRLARHPRFAAVDAAIGTQGFKIVFLLRLSPLFPFNLLNYAFGVRIKGGVDVDFGAAMERMRRLRADISKNDSAARLTRLGVDVFIGDGKFVGTDTVDVGGTRLCFSRAVIATGARAANLPIPGLAEAGFLTNETVFSLTELPRRFLVIGAGPIGCELAQAFRRFGSDVTVISDGRFLPREDRDAASVLSARFIREGIRVELGAKLKRVESGPGSRTIVFERDGKEELVVGDAILVAVGRAPNVEGLGLEAAGVVFDKRGVTVNDRLRTSNKRIFAAGDICSAYKFTHAADAMARIALQNALFFGRKKASALVIPWCTYTDPEIAHVGLYEDEAKKRGLDFVTLTVPLGEIDRAVLDGDGDGFARVHVQRKSGRILGATLVAAHAGEMIGEMSLAMTTGQKLSALAKTIHPYPTESEAWKRAGDAWNRTRLTPRGRAAQMNAGARIATGDVFLFFHADVNLPLDAPRWIELALEDPVVVAGAFRTHTVAEGARSWSSRFLRLADLRSRLTRLPYGDQAIFVRSDAFARVGGFPSLPIMEDVELCRRLRRIGTIRTVSASVRVSGRRFVRRPFLAAVLVNTLLFLFRLGVEPDLLARLYGVVR